jgi:hypothetical protein
MRAQEQFSSARGRLHPVMRRIHWFRLSRSKRIEDMSPKPVYHLHENLKAHWPEATRQIFTLAKRIVRAELGPEITENAKLKPDKNTKT